MDNSLTVIIPFYNEESTIVELLDAVLKVKVADYIFLVDDGSTDKSKYLIEKYIDNSKIFYFYKENLGKGSCLEHVKKKITTSHYIMQDGDLEYNPEDLSKMFEISKKNSESLILGSREIDFALRKNKYRLFRFGAKIISYVFFLVNQYRVTDIATGYLLVPTKFLQSIELEEKGFGIEIEIISKFIKSGGIILETPISYTARSIEEGKKITYKDGLRILFLVFKFKFSGKSNSKFINNK